MLYYSNQRLFASFVAFLLCLTSIRHSFGQIIQFQPTEIVVSDDCGVPAFSLSTAYHVAVDSLSKKYGIPTGTNSSAKYKYLIICKISASDTWEPRFGEQFKYMNTTTLVDALQKREIIRIENYPRDLRALKTPDALNKYFKDTNNNIFNLFSGYGSHRKVDNPVAAIRLTIDASIKLNPIKSVVSDVFFQNQSALKYNLIDKNEDITGHKIYVIKAKIQENSNGTILVSLNFNGSVDLLYDGKPIQSEFQVEIADLKNKDFSFLLAKMTSSLYKFSKSNFE